MKKLVILVMLVIFNFTLLALNIKAESIEDDKIDIEITRDNNIISINHLSSYDFKKVVYEYVIIKDNNYVSYLKETELNNNKFEIENDYLAIKVRLLKYIKNNTYYTIAVSNDNQKNYAGSIKIINNSSKINYIEIETILIRKTTDDNQKNHAYYEFFFNFNREHDLLKKVELQYVKYDVESYLFGLIKKKKNYKTVNEIVKYDDKFPSDKYKLEKNTDNNIKANYVVRFDYDWNLAEWGNHRAIENVAIIKIEYTLNNNTFDLDVLNSPSSPEPEWNWFLEFIEKIQKLLSKLKDFISSNTHNIIIVIIAIIAILALSVFTKILSIFTFIFKLIKSFINLIFKSIKYLFVPRKRKKGRYNDRI